MESVPAHLLRWITPDETAAQFLKRQAVEAVPTGLPFIDAHVTLRPGSVLEVVGPSGSAKSEMLIQAALNILLRSHGPAESSDAKSEHVVVVDCGGSFDLLRLVQVLKYRVETGRLQLDISGLLQQLHVVRCFSSLELLVALATLPGQLAAKQGLSQQLRCPVMVTKQAGVLRQDRPQHAARLAQKELLMPQWQSAVSSRLLLLPVVGPNQTLQDTDADVFAPQHNKQLQDGQDGGNPAPYAETASVNKQPAHNTTAENTLFSASVASSADGAAELTTTKADDIADVPRYTFVTDQQQCSSTDSGCSPGYSMRCLLAQDLKSPGLQSNSAAAGQLLLKSTSTHGGSSISSEVTSVAASNARVTEAALPAPAEVALPAPAEVALPAPAEVALPAPAEVALPAPAEVALPAPAAQNQLSFKLLGPLTSLYGYLMWWLAGIGLAVVMVIELVANRIEVMLAVSKNPAEKPPVPANQATPGPKIICADDLKYNDSKQLGRHGSDSSNSSWLSSCMDEAARPPAQRLHARKSAGTTDGGDSDPAGGWFASD
eukprot:gene2887-3177_t